MKARKAPGRQPENPEPEASALSYQVPEDATPEQRREALYQAIRRAQAFMHKKASPDPVMEIVRERYPTPAFFLESNRRSLEGAGLYWMDAFYYTMIPALTRTCSSQQWGAKPCLNTLAKMGAFLKTLYIGVHVECFYVVLLNRTGHLIRAALLQRGDVDNAPFYLRPLLSTALMESARYVVLAHNHPGGTKRPSPEDLKCTLKALSAFAPLRIPMLDHVIIAGNAVVSIRQTGLLPDVLWTAASPRSKVIRNWMNDET